MSTSERALATVRLGLSEYRAANPWHVVVGTAWLRAVLQCLFFTLLGHVAAGEAGARFAFVGAVAMVLLSSTVTGVAEVPASEKWYGTYFRLLRSGQSPAGVFALRSLPWMGQGLTSVALCLALVGPATGNADLSVAMLPAVPLLVLMAATSTAAGLAVASPAMGSRAEDLLSNLMMYMVIAAGGLLVPAGRLPWLDAVGSVLPLRHGLLAVRAVIDGGPWLGHAALEALVGACWAALAVLLFGRQAARARVTGRDDFA